MTESEKYVLHSFSVIYLLRPKLNQSIKHQGEVLFQTMGVNTYIMLVFSVIVFPHFSKECMK